jgi:hypothetical protein
MTTDALLAETWRKKTDDDFSGVCIKESKRGSG